MASLQAVAPGSPCPTRSSLVLEVGVTAHNKRSGSPSLEYNLEYKRRPYIRKIITVSEPFTHSEPRNVAGDVKRREEKSVTALAPPLKATTSKTAARHDGAGDEDEEEGDGELGPGDGGENEDKGDSDGEDGSQQRMQGELSGDEFELGSITSSVDMDEEFDWERHERHSRVQPTPHVLLDATSRELDKISDGQYRFRRKAADLDGPGWKMYHADRKGLGIQIYRLFSDGGRVWRYKGHNTGNGENVLDVGDCDRRTEISVEQLEDAGWRWKAVRWHWERPRTSDEDSFYFMGDPSIPPLPESLKSAKGPEALAGPSSIDPRDIGRAF